MSNTIKMKAPLNCGDFTYGTDVYSVDENGEISIPASLGANAAGMGFSFIESKPATAPAPAETPAPATEPEVAPEHTPAPAPAE